MEYFYLILSCILIVKAADILVDSASSIAIKLKVPKILIALTIVAFGTCAPEIGISFTSMASGNASMNLANVVGSCIINILMIIGLASFLHPIKLRHATIKKELPLLVFITSIFSLLVLDSILIPAKKNMLSRADGIILLILFFIFMLYLVNMVRKRKEEGEDKPKYGIVLSCVLLLLSIVLIILSSDVLVESAVAIAHQLNISEKIITMVVVVIGTSLPELAMTVRAAKRQEYDMAIGNIIGTNIFNICVVLGLPVTLYGGLEIVDFHAVDMLAVLLSTIILYFFSKSEKTLTKIEGFLMFLVFVLYYIYILFF